MTLAGIYQTLKNEYKSGQFFLQDGMIGWIYKTEGACNAKEAEDRWLSFLGAKITTETVIQDTDYEIYQKFDCNNRIGFFIREKENR